MEYSNKPISKYKKRKIIFCFCLDLTATQTALMLHINRKTINKYFNISDSWRGYSGLVDVGYDRHFRINHKVDQFSKGRVHVNGIESFWSYTKRRLTKFNGVKKNFHLHLKECEWRWNKTPQHLESELLQIVKVLV